MKKWIAPLLLSLVLLVRPTLAVEDNNTPKIDKAIKAETAKDAPISPQQLENLFKKKPGVWKRTILEFPAESIYFYAAQGLVLTTTLLTMTNNDPQAVTMFLEQPKDPVGHISFFSFMLMSRFVDGNLSKLIEPRAVKLADNKWEVKTILDPKSKSAQILAPLKGFLGMGAGMLMSHIVSDLLLDPNLKACATEMIGGFDKVACGDAYKDWVTSGRLTRYAPDLVMLFSAAIGGALTYNTAKKMVFKALSISAEKIKFAGAYGKLFQFTSFLMFDHILRSQIEVPLQNVLYEGHLINEDFINFGLVSSIRNDLDENLENKNFNAAKENLLELKKERTKYYDAVSKNSTHIFSSWAQNITDFMREIELTENFYKTFLQMVQSENRLLEVDNPYYYVGFNAEDKLLKGLWIEDQFSMDDLENVIVNPLLVERFCLNQDFIDGENVKAICVRLIELKRSHLKSVAAKLVINEDDFIGGLYIRPKKRQIEFMKIVKRNLQSLYKIGPTIKLVNKFAKQEKFARKQAGNFSPGPWQKLTYEINGFQENDLSGMWENSKQSIMSFLGPDPDRAEYEFPKNQFRLATPLDAGESITKWYTYQYIKGAQERFYPEDEFKSFEQYLLYSMACGADSKNVTFVEKSMKFEFKAPKIMDIDLSCRKLKKKSVGEIIKIYREAGKSIDFRQTWNDLVLTEIQAKLPLMLFDFNETFLRDALDKDFDKSAWARDALGGKNLKTLLLQDFDYLMGHLKAYGVEQSLAKKLKEDFTNVLTLEEAGIENKIADLRGRIGLPIRDFMNNLTAVMAGEKDGSLSVKFREQRPSLDDIINLRKEFGHYNDDGQRKYDEEIYQQLLKRIYSIVICSPELNQEEGNAMMLEVRNFLALNTPNMVTIYDMEYMVKNYIGSVKYTLSVGKCSRDESMEGSAETDVISLIIQGLEQVLSYGELKISQTMELRNHFETIIDGGRQ